MTNAGIAVIRVGDAVRRFRRIVDLHAEGKLNWAQAETVRLEVEQLYQTYTDILVTMSDDEFAKHLNSRRRPL